MYPFSTPDVIALAWFCGVWIAYAITVEWTAYGATSLNAQANRYRFMWMREMLGRDVRIIDTQIMASLQNGTAFFASTSLIALGGSLTILRSTDELIEVVGALPFGAPTTRLQWEAKVIGLAVIFAYAFFKFAWSYRLFNYVAIMLGATPPVEQKDTPQALDHANRTAKLSEEAGRHFNRGQRAFFFAVGYLGWFISPWVFMAATTIVLGVLWQRQFASQASRAVGS